MYRVHMRTMKYIYLITTIWCGATITGHAQQAPRDSTYNFTLQDCINYAYQHQDTVLNSALDIKTADYKVKEVIATGLPQINGSANFQDYFKIPAQPVLASQFSSSAPAGKLIAFSLGLKYSSTLTATASQMIFSPSFFVGLQASKTYKELSQRSYTRSKIEANVNVSKAYYQVLVSNEQINLLDANIKQLQQQLKETIQENKQGLVEKIDVDRLTVQYNNVVTSRENTLRLLVLNYELLKFQMGMPINTYLVLTDKLESVKLDSLAEEANVDTGFYRKRIEYSLLETNKRLNELDMKNKKAAFLPSLTANGNLSTAFYSNTFSGLYAYNYPFSYVGVTLSIPIFDGGQRTNQLRESRIAIMKSENDMANLKNAISLQASSSRISYINSLKTLDIQKQNRVLAEEVFHVARVKYQQGVGSSIEVTQAETDLVNADNQYIQSLYNALISKISLDQAYGRIK